MRTLRQSEIIMCRVLSHSLMENLLDNPLVSMQVIVSWMHQRFTCVAFRTPAGELLPYHGLRRFAGSVGISGLPHEMYFPTPSPYNIVIPDSILGRSSIGIFG